MSVTKVTGMMQTGTKGGDIPSASTLVIDTDGDYFDITGTTGITAMTVDAGRRFTLQFDGALTLTHGSSLYLPGATNFTTEANDSLDFIATAANTVRCIGYALKDGGSPVSSSVAGDNAFAVGGASNQSVSSASTTKIVLDNEIFDVGGNFASNKFTVPSGGAGKYLITFNHSLGGSSNDITKSVISIYKNGSQEAVVNQLEGTSTARHRSCTMTAIMSLADSDYIEFYTHIAGTSPFVVFEYSSCSYDGTWVSGCKISD